MKVLIDSKFNPVTGLTTNYYSQNGGKQVVIQVVQDVEPIFDQNKAEMSRHNSKARRTTPSGLGNKVASIPMGVVENVHKERGLNLVTCSMADMKRFLNDRDNCKVRTAPGRL